MTNDDTEIADLKAKIADLEAQLTKLANKHQRDVKALMGCDDVLSKHRKAMNAELNDAFERIINLELTVFPHLSGDITRLNRLIGEGDQRAYNPLDFRDRIKKT
jgi:predicted  nucleic acid-binding Zn-ribbon protein